MFHGILWDSAHEEKYPLTTDARDSLVARGEEERRRRAVGEADDAHP